MPTNSQATCATLVGVVFFLSVIIIIKTAYNLKKWSSSWILTYLTMIFYALTQASCVVYYFGFFLDTLKVSALGRSMLYSFYIISLDFTLIVFVNRIRKTFGNTIYKFSKKIMYFLYIWILTVVILSLIMVPVIFYCISSHLDYNSIPQSLLFIIFAMMASHMISLICLSIIMLYMFVSKLFQVQKSITTSTNSNLYQYDSELMELQLRMTVLVMVCILSTFMFAALTFVFMEFIPTDYQVVHFSLCTFADSFFGLICMAFTIKTNNRLYRKACVVCEMCMLCLLSLPPSDIPLHPMVALSLSSKSASTPSSNITKNKIISTAKNESPPELEFPDIDFIL